MQAADHMKHLKHLRNSEPALWGGGGGVWHQIMARQYTGKTEVQSGSELNRIASFN